MRFSLPFFNWYLKKEVIVVKLQTISETQLSDHQHIQKPKSIKERIIKSQNHSDENIGSKVLSVPEIYLFLCVRLIKFSET